VTRVVVDASVLVACALSDGSSRRVLLQTAQTEFFAPEFVSEELRRKSPKIIALSGIAPSVLAVLLDDLLDRVNIVPFQGYAHRMEQARALTRAAEPLGDEDYVALSLALDAPIWTYDKDFNRIQGIKLTNRYQIG
jgi:predicted nucleic acid-binding protein